MDAPYIPESTAPSTSDNVIDSLRKIAYIYAPTGENAPSLSDNMHDLFRKIHSAIYVSV